MLPSLSVVNQEDIAAWESQNSRAMLSRLVGQQLQPRIFVNTCGITRIEQINAVNAHTKSEGAVTNG